jgi:hypothetical protein
MEHDKVKDLLNAIGIDASILHPNAQSMLEKISALSLELNCEPDVHTIQIALGRLVNRYQECYNAAISDQKLLLNIQNSYKTSFLLLQKVKELHDFSQSSSSKDTLQDIKHNLEPAKYELISQLESTPLIEIDDSYRHEHLLALGEECQRIAEEAAELQVKSEFLSYFPAVRYS